MTQPLANQRDPIGWSALIVGLFAAFVLFRLGTPTRFYFDEVHYVPATRIMMEFDHISNREHPMFGKQLLALGMVIFGDNPIGWRALPALCGILTLGAFMRGMWHASRSRFATLAAGILLATGFVLFVQSRIAMLDIFMVCFCMVGLWQVAGAVRNPRQARWRLALAGIALGLALGSKWNAAPIVILPGFAFLILRLEAAQGRFLTATDVGPIKGISLVEAGVWLGLVPLLVYLATFWPVFFYVKDPLTISGYWEYHQKMWELQQQTVKPHPYMSRWYHWVVDWRAIWYLYENVDGAQRGVLLLGNPFTMIAGLPALAWCAFQGVFRQHKAALAFFTLYAVTLGMWIVAPKPIQFYYHYFMPSCFLLGALALALDGFWRAGYRNLALGALAASVVIFALFYPILSSTPLAGPYSYEYWMWLDSWR